MTRTPCLLLLLLLSALPAAGAVPPGVETGYGWACVVVPSAPRACEESVAGQRCVRVGSDAWCVPDLACGEGFCLYPIEDGFCVFYGDQWCARSEGHCLEETITTGAPNLVCAPVLPQPCALAPCPVTVTPASTGACVEGSDVPATCAGLAPREGGTGRCAYGPFLHECVAVVREERGTAMHTCVEAGASYYCVPVAP